MVENAILFISKDSEPLLFDGTAFTPVALKKNRDYFSAGLIPAPLLRTHGLRADKKVAPEKLEIQTEMSMYEEAGLDPETDFKIASVAIELDNENDLYIESYAIETATLTREFGKVAEKLGQIDALCPSYLKYEALYAYEKLEPKNDVFIYFAENEAYAAMYRQGHYISHRMIVTLAELAEKLEMGIPELKKLLSGKGIENENYLSEEFLKMSTVQQELSKAAERIGHAISHKRGVFGLDRIDRFYIDFEGNPIPGFLELFQGYGYQEAELLACSLFSEIDAAYRPHALEALYLLGVMQGRCKGANLSIFERRPPFYKSHAGIFFSILSASVVLALAYPLYALYTLSELETRRDTLQQQVNEMESLTQRLQIKLKEVRSERDRLEEERQARVTEIEAYGAMVDELKNQRDEKHQRQQMMEDVNKALAAYKLSSRVLDQNGTQRVSVQIISEYEKRDDIAKFMKRLIAAGYPHVTTREVRREENLYESLVEIER